MIGTRSLALSTLRIVFVAYAAFIVLLSLAPSEPEMPAGVSDKLVHFGAYALMALIGMPLAATPRGRTALLFSIVAIGAGLEAIQAAVPQRSASGWDLVADAIGAVAGSLVWLTVLRLRKALVASDHL